VTLFLVPYVMGLATALLGVVVLKLFRAWRFRRAIERVYDDFERAGRSMLE